ncbi:hypothetical protein [Microbulbifer thermotolerans]|uniref:hypothetical protein n=1 Tax=Microbulbifer thermotolerans TaxID=252514 RepID=UPI00224B7471|nr:hypothetical protein [Microbulbifer thermotolerans]MCX2781316.1 hypothetical protein [Microbulbifer thermotolerans]MCX2806696.1 hypothetical protein [Microbulbifer thermotolerans]
MQTDAEALELAIKPGVSRISANSGGNIFDNSGFGLYVLSEIGDRFGWFAIGSGRSRLIGNNGERVLEDFVFPGTFIGIQVFNRITNFSDVLSEIIRKGEKIAGVNGISNKASGASKVVKL